MLDFTRVRAKEITINDLTADLTVADLRRLTHEMIDHMQNAIKDSTDADVVFTPLDPQANDTFASKPEDVSIAWSLGHLIVHVTASAEEAAFLAAELARGVENHGRSRSEIPWETVTTIAQCRQRLEESRRMRIASLELWPAQPYLDNRYQPYASSPPLNCISRFCSGLSHDDSHLGQIDDVVAQAKAVRK